MATRERLATLVARQSERAFVGREPELEFLDDLARGGERRVVQLHSVAGIGKSALLDAFLERARHDDVAIVRLDCRSIEPTERGFLEALGRAAGGSPLDADAMALRLGALAERVVLALDHYEVFRLMDTWLRQAFVPALADQVRVILVGREAPVAGWFSVGWEGLFRSLPVGALGESEAELLLERRGIEGESARRLNRIARGHPLALTLASAAVAERPDIGLEEAATGRVVSELARLYLEDVDDAVTREALEAAAVVRRTTQPLLRAMLPDFAPQDAFERLLALPFTELASDGLFVHDAVREALSAYLSSTDASRHSALRRAAKRGDAPLESHARDQLVRHVVVLAVQGRSQVALDRCSCLLLPSPGTVGSPTARSMHGVPGSPGGDERRPRRREPRSRTPERLRDAQRRLSRLSCHGSRMDRVVHCDLPPRGRAHHGRMGQLGPALDPGAAGLRPPGRRSSCRGPPRRSWAAFPVGRRGR